MRHKETRAEEPIRANFDGEVLRNISRSQLPVARPQLRIDGESCEDRTATLYSCFKFPYFTFAKFSREVWWSRRQEWHFFYPERVIFRLSFYTPRGSLGRSQFALSRMNIFFLSMLSDDLLYPASLSALAFVFPILNLWTYFCPDKKDVIYFLFWLSLLLQIFI